ncbi:MAG: hypothetical protein JNL70_01050 [Saprospiraceae bacterium]|nr:hypothetical protein [Saprospiraceae bacterium]
MFQTPILFIIFNRPKETAKVFERIRQIQPKQLFIAADGPRESNIADLKHCEQARQVVKQIDWNCSVKTLFREKNLGCGQAVSEAITWFFGHIEEGIILEDDCLPELSFFSFCSLMLNKYRNESKIMQIAGTNYLFNNSKSQANRYYFSAYNSVWGWATWRHAWQYYEFEIKSLDKIHKILEKRFLNTDLKNWLEQSFKAVYEGKVDTWDFQWNFIFQKMDGLCIVPNVNLIKNIGYFGTHYWGKTHLSNMPTLEFDLDNILEPFNMAIDFEKDNIAALHLTDFELSFYKKLENKIFCIFKNINLE